MSPPAPLMRAVVATAGGALRLSRVPPPSASPSQVLLAVAATAVNRADLLQAAGRYPPPDGVTPVLGLEAAGTVMGTPPAGSGLARGDRVVALLQGGGYADVAAADVGCVLRLPPGWGGDDWAVRGAAVMEAWVAAYQVLLLGGCVRPPAAAAGGGPPPPPIEGTAPWGGSPPLPPRSPPPRSVLVTAAAAAAKRRRPTGHMMNAYGARGRGRSARKEGADVGGRGGGEVGCSLVAMKQTLGQARPWADGTTGEQRARARTNGSRPHWMDNRESINPLFVAYISPDTFS